ncbi:hypothetical protein TNCV_4467581, partial [Trichonephila clavipes]
ARLGGREMIAVVQIVLQPRNSTSVAELANRWLDRGSRNVLVGAWKYVFLVAVRQTETNTPHHHGANKGRQPAGHLTCVRHGTYLRGGTGYSSTGSGCDPPVRRALTAILPKATVVGIPKEPVLESAELITSGLTGAGSLLPPVYGEHGPKGTQQEPQTPLSPGTGRRTRQTCRGQTQKPVLAIS